MSVYQLYRLAAQNSNPSFEFDASAASGGKQRSKSSTETATSDKPEQKSTGAADSSALQRITAFIPSDVLSFYVSAVGIAAKFSPPVNIK